MADYVVFQADLDRDREQILAVWSRNLKPRPQELQRKKFAWHYLENPCGPGKCWLLAAQPSGDVVGTCGLSPRKMRLGAKTIVVGHASDLAVDAKHRGIRPAVLLQKSLKTSLGDGLSFIYTAPNERARTTMQLAGFQVVGQFCRFAKLLNVGSYLRGLPPVVRIAAAPTLNVALRFGSTEFWTRRDGYELEEVADTDERFDRLSGAPCGFQLMGERTSEFLRWRYLRCPLQRYHLLALVTATRERIAGYCACWLGPERQLAVIDLFAESDEVSLSVLRLLAPWARKQGAHSISIAFAGHPQWTTGLRRLGFRPRIDQRSLVAAPSEPLKQLLTHSSGTRLFPGDEDYND